jgi:hypothetical protein
MELYKKICKNQKCGKEFMGTRTQQYCCPECRVPTYIPKRKYKQIKNCTLGEVMAEAKKLGVSYGKYVAMQYLEEQRERMKEHREQTKGKKSY